MQRTASTIFENISNIFINMQARRRARRRAKPVKKAASKPKQKAIIKQKKVDGKIVRINLTSLENQLNKKCVHQSWQYYRFAQYGRGNNQKEKNYVLQLVINYLMHIRQESK